MLKTLCSVLRQLVPLFYFILFKGYWIDVVIGVSVLEPRPLTSIESTSRKIRHWKEGSNLLECQSQRLMKQFKFLRDFVNVMKFTTNFVTQTRLSLLLRSYLTSISGLFVHILVYFSLFTMFELHRPSFFFMPMPHFITS